MIKIKLEKNKRCEPVFKVALADEYIDKYRILKRIIFESRKLKGEYNYNIPMRFFEIFLRTIPKDEIEIHNDSIDFYLEYSDSYDDKYYYRTEANASYMKNWRLEGCPVIYKVNIHKNEKKLSKEIAFKKLNNLIR